MANINRILLRNLKTKQFNIIRLFSRSSAQYPTASIYLKAVAGGVLLCGAYETFNFAKVDAAQVKNVNNELSLTFDTISFNCLIVTVGYDLIK